MLGVDALVEIACFSHRNLVTHDLLLLQLCPSWCGLVCAIVLLGSKSGLSGRIFSGRRVHTHTYAQTDPIVRLCGVCICGCAWRWPCAVCAARQDSPTSGLGAGACVWLSRKESREQRGWRGLCCCVYLLCSVLCLYLSVCPHTLNCT